jgi:hypothetical protein
MPEILAREKKKFSGNGLGDATIPTCRISRRAPGARRPRKARCLNSPLATGRRMPGQPDSIARPPASGFSAKIRNHIATAGFTHWNYGIKIAGFFE